jgi:hypothetical protein
MIEGIKEKYPLPYAQLKLKLEAYQWFKSLKRFRKPGAPHVILRKYKLVYLNMPKVACTSIRFSLGILVVGESFSREKPLYVHEGFFVGRELNVIAADYDHYFKFTFVRNPWDRLVSCYSGKIAGPTMKLAEMQKFGLYAGMPFEEFVPKVCEIPDELADPHFRSQHSHTTYRGRFLPDFVGRFERMHEDWARLQEILTPRIGTPLPDLPHKNEGKHRSYQSYYNPELRALVAKRYRQDIELFAYQFE